VADESEVVHAELRRDTKRLKLLLELAGEAVSNKDLHGLVRAIMMRIKSATDSDSVCLLLGNTREGELDFYSLDFSSEASSFNKRTVIAPPATIGKYLLRPGKPWAGTREQAGANFQTQLLLKEQFATGVHGAILRP
jgi:hypothetical protein